MSLHTAVAPVVALLVASWSIGAYEERLRAVLGLALLVCAVWLSMGIDVLRGTDHYTPTDVPWIGMLLLLPESSESSSARERVAFARRKPEHYAWSSSGVRRSPTSACGSRVSSMT